MGYLNVASVRLCTEAEGPGKRFALWVQGCKHCCPGCCNPEMQEMKTNIIVDAVDVIGLIKSAKEQFDIEGVSFIGGEPILQSSGLSEIAEWCQSVRLSVLVFTGYLYEDLISSDDIDVKRLLDNIDILVDGPFIQDEYDDVRDWVGSKNQKVLLLSDRYEPGIEFTHNQRTMEVLVSDDSIFVNGWPF